MIQHICETMVRFQDMYVYIKPQEVYESCYYELVSSLVCNHLVAIYTGHCSGLRAR